MDTKTDKIINVIFVMIDFESISVSVFNNCYDKVPVKTVNLHDALFALADRAEVDEARRIEDKEARDEVKRGLYAFTPSGVFENLFEGARPQAYSGMMCIDIDKKENPEMNVEETKPLLAKIDQVAYCGLSVSGRGLFLLVPIADPACYNLHYEAFSEMLMKYFGLKTDPSCKNIGRLRVASYDENPYVNPNASTLYAKKVEPQVTRIPVYQYRISSGHSSFDKDTAEKVDRYISYLCTHGIDITNDYDLWFRIGCALANEFGEAGRERFHYVSSISCKYKQRECDRKYDNILKSNPRTTIGTFFYYCHQAGVKL